MHDAARMCASVRNTCATMAPISTIVRGYRQFYILWYYKVNNDETNDKRQLKKVGVQYFGFMLFLNSSIKYIQEPEQTILDGMKFILEIRFLWEVNSWKFKWIENCKGIAFVTIFCFIFLIIKNIHSFETN